MGDTILENVRTILDRYGHHIKNNKQLILLYWQRIDGVEMDKRSISTTDFLSKATNPEDIINAMTLIEIIEKER